MAGLVLLITGTRQNLLNKGKILISRILDENVLYRPGFTPLIVMHGDCPTGVDHYVQCNSGLNANHLWPFPAKWKLQGKSAGIQRNIEMVNTAQKFNLYGHTVKVLAFPSLGNSPGTNHCIEVARKAKLNVTVYNLEPGIDHVIRK